MKILTKSLSLLLIFVIGINAFVRAQEKSESSAQRIKDQIQTYGIGLDSPFEVVLHNNQKWKGYISEATADTFVLVYNKKGNSATFQYSQVKQIKSTKVSKRKKIAIGTAVTGGLLFLIWILVSTRD
jgi:hypothetical protein